eukprot:888917_1
MAYHGLGPAATQLLDSAPSSSRGGHPGCPCSVLATSSAQHASLQTQASLPLPSSSSCPASALHRHSLLVPMSSTSDMVLLQHVHQPSRANRHPSFEYGRHRQTFYSHPLDSSRLSPIIDVLSTQIGAACRLSHKLGPLAAYHRQHHQQSSRLRLPSATNSDLSSNDSDLSSHDFGGLLCITPPRDTTTKPKPLPHEQATSSYPTSL